MQVPIADRQTDGYPVSVTVSYQHLKGGYLLTPCVCPGLSGPISACSSKCEQRVAQRGAWSVEREASVERGAWSVERKNGSSTPRFTLHASRSTLHAEPHAPRSSSTPSTCQHGSRSTLSRTRHSFTRSDPCRKRVLLFARRRRCRRPPPSAADTALGSVIGDGGQPAVADQTQYTDSTYSYSTFVTGDGTHFMPSGDAPARCHDGRRVPRDAPSRRP